jgi:hypothetical protein
LREDWPLKWFRRIARHGIKAPYELAGIRIVGRDIAARANLRAAVTDNHFTFYDARRARDRVAPVRIDGKLLPNWKAGSGIKRDEPSVERADKNLFLPNCDAAIYDIATRVYAPLRRYLRIVRPQSCAGCGIQRKTPCSTR